MGDHQDTFVCPTIGLTGSFAEITMAFATTTSVTSTRPLSAGCRAGQTAAFIQRFTESSAPIVQLAHRAIAGALDLPFDEAVRHAEDVYLNMLMATEDVEEGLKAVVEKRKPAWKDR